MPSEVDHYLAMIEDLRGQVRDLVAADLPAEALNWRPLEDRDDRAINSLAVLAAHAAEAAHFWMAEVIGRYPPTRDREAEFVLMKRAGRLAQHPVL